jgi:ribosome-binding protein aMBF1 (putative translation factor)
MSGPISFDNDLKKIEEAMAELKARAKQLRSRVSQRTRLLRYVTEQGYTRSDLMSCVPHMPKTRLTRKDREKRLAEVRQKHAPKVKRKQTVLKNKPKPENMAAAHQLKAAREAKGWTMQELAGKIGVHGSMISSWELGKWGVTPENRKKLEAALGFKF